MPLPPSDTRVVAPCPPDMPVLTLNGNPATPTASGGVSLTLDPTAARVFSGAASALTGREIAFQPNTNISVDPAARGGYTLGLSPALSVGFAKSKLSVDSVSFGSEGNVTKVHADWHGISKGVSRAVQHELNKTLGKLGKLGGNLGKLGKLGDRRDVFYSF